MGRAVRRTAGLHYLTGQIAHLEQRRDFLYSRMGRDLAEIEGIDQLLPDLDHLRQQC